MSTTTGSRARRRQAIVELISAERLGSQEEIRARLATLGLQATQSTISRDLEELGLARVHDADGVRYVAARGSGHRRRRRGCVDCWRNSPSRSYGPTSG